MRLGIIGGGQLARMLALAARPLGIDCLVVEPSENPPAQSVATVLRAGYDDPAALEALTSCDAVTVELEAVPIASLEWLAVHVPVRPCAAAVATAADRLVEKELFRSLGVTTAPFADEVVELPAIVKSRRGGFDGRGNQWVNTTDALAAARRTLPDPIVEGVVVFTREVSIICARSITGTVACWPVVENTHEHGILRRTVAVPVEPSLQAAAVSIAHRVVERLDYVGVLAIELFELSDGSLVANEMAPRVHNSGHWTIEGAHTSQFEQHVRAVCGLPLGDPSMRQPTVMLNAVGRMPVAETVLDVPGAHLHNYNKTPRPGRKVGHVTVVASTLELLDQRVSQLVEHVPFDTVPAEHVPF